MFRSLMKIGGAALKSASKFRGKVHATAKFAATGGLPPARGPEAFLTKKALEGFSHGLAAATKTDTRAVVSGAALIGGAAYTAKKLDW